MLYAEMGNRVIEISEAQVELYNSKGYEIKDDKGAIVKTVASKDLEVLNAKYQEALDENKALKDEIAKLKSDIAKLKKPAKASEVADEKVEEKKSAKK